MRVYVSCIVYARAHECIKKIASRLIPTGFEKKRVRWNERVIDASRFIFQPLKLMSVTLDGSSRPSIASICANGNFSSAVGKLEYRDLCTR